MQRGTSHALTSSKGYPSSTKHGHRQCLPALAMTKSCSAALIPYPRPVQYRQCMVLSLSACLMPLPCTVSSPLCVVSHSSTNMPQVLLHCTPQGATSNRSLSLCNFESRAARFAQTFALCPCSLPSGAPNKSSFLRRPHRVLMVSSRPEHILLNDPDHCSSLVPIPWHMGLEEKCLGGRTGRPDGIIFLPCTAHNI